MIKDWCLSENFSILSRKAQFTKEDTALCSKLEQLREQMSASKIMKFLFTILLSIVICLQQIPFMLLLIN